MADGVDEFGVSLDTALSLSPMDDEFKEDSHGSAGLCTFSDIYLL